MAGVEVNPWPAADLRRPVDDPASRLARRGRAADPLAEAGEPASEGPLRKTFQQVFGETLFRLVLKQMRQSLGSGGLFSKGAAAQITFGLFDEHLAQVLAQAQPPGFAARYFEQFQRWRQKDS